MNASKMSLDVRNKVAGLMTGVNAALLSTMAMAYADEGYGVWNGVTNTLTNVLGTLESALKSIVVPIAGVALIFCFIMMMISQSQKKVESYRTWCVTIIICIVAIYAVPFIINLASSIGTQFGS